MLRYKMSMKQHAGYGLKPLTGMYSTTKKKYAFKTMRLLLLRSR